MLHQECNQLMLLESIKTKVLLHDHRQDKPTILNDVYLQDIKETTSSFTILTFRVRYSNVLELSSTILAGSTAVITSFSTSTLFSSSNTTSNKAFVDGFFGTAEQQLAGMIEAEKVPILFPMSSISSLSNPNKGLNINEEN